jgi:hypothetical protein
MHLASSQLMPSMIFRAMYLELGANEAICRPCFKNARIINHQSGPWGVRAGAGMRFGFVFSSKDEWTLAIVVTPGWASQE